VSASSLPSALRDVLGAWGRPPDEPAKLAAGLALVGLLLVLTGRGRSLFGLGPTPLPSRLFLWITAFTAALLSILYIAIYLRGGPRIVDATTYFLQGRALSHGDFSWPAGDPSASFRGRFLLYREGGGGGDGVVGGIFPPGYPMLLALGFGMGAPMVVGPAIAAALVVATHRLARTIAEDALGPVPLVEPIARTAALLSVFCGALRYHTADTMSHGLTALGLALALDAALRRRAVVAGLVVGAVVATRPMSAVALGLVALVLLLRSPAPGAPVTPAARSVLKSFFLATLPGVLVFVLAQHAVTGAWFTSSQRMYYATSDGPPGCWGIGKDAGCLYEHGEFVEARFASGFGLLAAVGTTLRRLRMHLLDVGNLEPLALLVLVPLARLRGRAKRSPAVVAALALVGLHMLAYAPFYFDGNYPGGGARLFADVLPIEHALLALAVARLVSSPRYVRGALALVGATLAGFAVHASFDHGKLAERDGGRPMFEPDVLARANVTSGLVFVDTDHGFALGHDPSARIKNGVVVARLRNDDRDRLLYDRLDRPPTYIYKFEVPPPSGATPAPLMATAAVIPWAPPPIGDPTRYEAESEWPVLSQSGGFAVPVFCDACAGGTRALMLTPTPLSGRARATITVPISEPGRYSVGIRIVQGTKLPHAKTRGPTVPDGAITVGDQRWEWIDVEGAGCADLPTREVALTPPVAHFVLEAHTGAVALDRVSLKRMP
jgi:hypothetical protein